MGGGRGGRGVGVVHEGADLGEAGGAETALGDEGEGLVVVGAGGGALRVVGEGVEAFEDLRDDDDGARTRGSGRSRRSKGACCGCAMRWSSLGMWGSPSTPHNEPPRRRR